MAAAAPVHDHGRLGEGRGQIAGGPAVVEVDVGQHDPGEVARTDACGVEGPAHGVSGGLGSHIDDGRPVGPHQICRGHPGDTGQHGVDDLN